MHRFIIRLLFVVLVCAGAVQADIYQWEYIDPAHPELGKQPSPTLCPDGAGATAMPAANLSYLDLTQAYLIGADLSGARTTGSTFTNADFGGANLGGMWAYGTDYTGADFTGAAHVATRGSACVALDRPRGYRPAPIHLPFAP